MEWTTILFILPVLGLSNGQYYGKLLGSFSEDAHELRGTIYAADEKRIIITGFNYDGLGPDAYFWVGKKDTTSSDKPNSEGTIIPDENGSTEILRAYSSQTIMLNLGSFTLRDIRWISVWCRKFAANFGWLKITDEMTSSLPAQKQISSFTTLAHGVSSGEVTVMDINTIMIKDFNYDGFAPDAFFLVGKGSPSASGTKIPDENGSLDIVKGYNSKDIMLHLPSPMTFFDIDYLSLFCIQYTQNFGEVTFTNLERGTIPPDVDQFKPTRNCETLQEGLLNVAWELEGSDVTIELTAAIDPNDYMAFGISGNPSSSAMVGGDVVVVWKKDGTANADDFYMNGYSLCSGNSGVCRDTADGGRQNVKLLEYNTVDGVTKARYRRPLNTGDNDFDKQIDPNTDSQIIWAIGGINEQQQPTKHHTRISANKKIQFGRETSYKCQPVRSKEKKDVVPWKKQYIYAKDGDILVASLGPTGGEMGYKAITGKQSWGIAWYINGLLIPEIVVRRGSNITFRVQGGEDPNESAKYHPFYITNDPVGGYADKNNDERQNVEIYPLNTAAGQVNEMTGKYCEFIAETGTNPESYGTFEEFQKKLRLQCDSGQYGEFEWYVAPDTPDTVFYQCYTHNYLGWKINVVDEFTGSASCQSFNIFVQLLSFVILLMISSFLY